MSCDEQLTVTISTAVAKSPGTLDWNRDGVVETLIAFAVSGQPKDIGISDRLQSPDCIAWCPSDVDVRVLNR